jgi:hypothetical protein
MKVKFKVDKLYTDGEKTYLTYFFEPVDEEK